MTINHSNSTTIKGDILLHSEFNDDHVVEGFDSTGAITLSSSGLVYFALRPDLDIGKITGAGKPTRVTRGVFFGYSLPVYAADNEELFWNTCVPRRWDGASDMTLRLACWLAGAEDSKNFKLQFAWENTTPDTDIIPNTNNIVEVETSTGASAAQYQSYQVDFTIDHDIDTPAVIECCDSLAGRLRRVAASADDCAGEIVIGHTCVVFRQNKLGSASL
jgi:hypothetical protein